MSDEVSVDPPGEPLPPGPAPGPADTSEQLVNDIQAKESSPPLPEKLPSVVESPKRLRHSALDSNRRQALYRGCAPPSIDLAISQKPPSGPPTPMRLIPHAPGSSGVKWSTAPLEPRKHMPTARESGPYDTRTGTIADWGVRNPRNYSGSFGSTQYRISQVPHATQLGAAEPTAGKTATEDVGPGQYRVPPILTHSISTPGGKLSQNPNGDDALASRGRVTLAARTVFRSTTPQLIAFREQAEADKELGPGSYNPKDVLEPSSASAGHRSSFASKRLQRASSWHGRTWQPSSSDVSVEPNRITATALERALKFTQPSAKGHTWSKAPRKTKMNQNDGVTRDSGRDKFYSDEVGTIKWNMVTGLHHLPPKNPNAKDQVASSPSFRDRR